MSTLASLRVELGMDTKDFESGSKRASGVASGLGSVIRNALSFAGGTLIAKGIEDTVRVVKDNIGEVFNAASDLNETVNKTDAVFGQSSKEIKSWAQNAASDFGISRQQAMESAATFGNLFETIGLGVPQAADMSEQIVQLASDLGSFDNIDPTQVLADLQSGLTGQMETVRKYGIDISDAAVQQEAFAEGITTSTKDMSQAQKVQLRYNIIMKQTTSAQGDFSKTSMYAANASRIFHAHIQDLRAELGTKFYPIVTQGIDFLNNFLDRFDKLINKGVNPFEAALEGLHFALDKAFGKDVGGEIFGFVNGVASVLQFFGGVAADAFGLLTGAVGAVLPSLRAFERAMKAAFDSGIPIKDLVEFLPPGLQNLERGFLLVADAIGDMVTSIKNGNFLADLPGEIAQLATGLGSIAINVVVDIASWVLRKVPNFTDWLDGIIGGTGGGGTAGMPGTSLPGQIGAGFGAGDAPHVTVSALAVDILGFAARQVANLWSWVEGLFGVGGTSATGDGTGGPDSDRVVTLSSVLVSIGKDALSLVGDAVTGIGSWVGDQVTTAWDAVKANAIPLGTATVSATFALASDFWGTAGNIASWISDQATSGWDRTVDFASATVNLTLSLWDKLWGDSAGPSDWIKNAAIGTWDHVVDFGSATINLALTLWDKLWDAAAGPSDWVKTNAVGTWDHIVDFGAATVNLALSLVSTVWGKASDLVGWLKGQLGISDSGTNVPGGTATVQITLALFHNTLGLAKDFATWVGDQLGISASSKTTVPGGEVDIQVTPKVVATSTATTKEHKGFLDKVGGMLTEGNDFVKSAVDGITQAFTSSAGYIAGAMVGVGADIFGAILVAIGTAVTHPEDIVKVVTSAVSAVVTEFAHVVGSDVLSPLWDGFKSGLGDTLSSKIGDALKGIDNPFSGWPGTIEGWLGGAFDTLKGWLTSGVPSFIKDLAKGDIMSAIGDVLGSGDSGGGISIAQQFSNLQGLMAGLFPNGLTEGAGAKGTHIEIGSASSFVAKPTIDSTAFDKSLGDIGAQVDAFAKATWTTKMAADIKQAQDANDRATQWGTIWSRSQFDSTYGTNTGMAALGDLAAHGMGNAWDAASFSSDYAIDRSAADSANSDAHAYADAWDGHVFTAAFSIDTSGLDTAKQAALDAVSFISSIMPHSPAKAGPLAREISFDYIHDALASTMGRMGPTANRGMAGVSNALGGSASFGIGGSGGATLGGGATVTVIFQAGAIQSQPGMDEEKLAERIGVHVGANLKRELEMR